VAREIATFLGAIGRARVFDAREAGAGEREEK